MPLLVLVMVILVILVIIVLVSLIFGLASGIGSSFKNLGERKRQRNEIRLAEIELEKQKARQEHEKEIAALDAMGLDGRHILGEEEEVRIEG